MSNKSNENTPDFLKSITAHSPDSGNKQVFFFCFQSETLRSEKEDLLAGMETMRSTLKQLETKNQEMQRQSANLERDLLAERSIKEQKIKVEMKRDGCHLPLLCKQLLCFIFFQIIIKTAMHSEFIFYNM